jgi:hypothetical protein
LSQMANTMSKGVQATNEFADRAPFTGLSAQR